MPIQWTQDLATGIHEIDEQHRDLYVNIAALRDAMRLGNARGAINTIGFLERYVRDHFATEERWMAATAYPGLEAHRAEHVAFTSAFGQRKSEFVAKGPTASLAIELSEWVGEWLHDHVQRVDREMGAFLRARQPARPG